MPGKFTDRQIAILYFNLSKHYKDCCDSLRSNSSDIDRAEYIYNQLYASVYYSLEGENSSLSGLNYVDKEKIYKVLNTFFYATPQYQTIPMQQQSASFFHNGAQKPLVMHNNVNHYYARRDDGFLFNWILLDSLNARSSRSYGGGYNYGHNYHQHQTQNKNDYSVLALLLLLILATAAAALTFIAMYYLLSETLDSLERFWYSEGWMQAALTLLSMPASTSASTLLAFVFATHPLISLTIAAGVANPAAWVIAGILCLGVIGGAAGCFISNKLQQSLIEYTSADALDPTDPNRFALTAAEEKRLIEKNIDPIKVKCAIIALRAQMGNEQVPSLLTRCSISSIHQGNLDKIRSLRRGDLCILTVGEMRFDCNADLMPRPVAPIFNSAHEQLPPPYPQHDNMQNQQSRSQQFFQERARYTIYPNFGSEAPQPSAPPAYGS